MTYKGIITTGIHTSGKTTTGKILSKILDFPYIPETAEILLQNGAEVILTSTSPLVRFKGNNDLYMWDKIIMSNELHRDNNINNELSIIETHHIGNIAHALIRSPEEIGTPYIDWLRDQRKNHNYFFDLIPLHLNLNLSSVSAKEIFGKRTKLYSENEIEKAIDFYQELSDIYFEIYKTLRLDPIIVDATQPLEIVINECVSKLQERKIKPN